MDARYLHLGSWNIEHFGRDDDDDRNDENRFAISEHIQLAGVDILALQEIYVTNREEFERGEVGVNSHLDGAIDLLLEQTGEQWHYELFRNRQRNDTSQLCGVLWNASKVDRKGPSLRLDVEHSAQGDGDRTLRLWDRAPHAVKFSTGAGKIDLIVVPLHMKANTGPRNVVEQIRYEEVRTLLATLPDAAEELEERDIVLLGDTNCTGRSEPAIQTLVREGFEDLNAADAPTFVRGDAPFDRIFVPSAADRKAFKFSRQYILRSASPLSHDRFLSDHYVVKTTVKILEDDDGLP
jgi:endonuclease/exonuclease/phosphatase family metal-dependent hydrolase